MFVNNSINERQERMVNDNYNRCIEAARVLASPQKNLGWNVELSQSQISGR